MRCALPCQHPGAAACAEPPSAAALGRRGVRRNMRRPAHRRPRERGLLGLLLGERPHHGHTAAGVRSPCHALPRAPPVRGLLLARAGTSGGVLRPLSISASGRAARWLRRSCSRLCAGRAAGLSRRRRVRRGRAGWSSRAVRTTQAEVGAGLAGICRRLCDEEDISVLPAYSIALPRRCL